jgi:hypothetical protein
MSTEDRYSYWHDALEGKPDLIISQNDPMPGFYRTKRGEPVAIWDNEIDNRVVMVVADSMIDPDNHEEWWTRCATRPVTEEQWKFYAKTGYWHDMDATIADTLGDNIRDANDPEGIRALLDALEEAAKSYTRIEDAESEKKAQSLRSRLLELKAKADKIRVDLKAPHLKASAKVDATWMPLVKAADAMVTALRKAMEVYRTKLIVLENQRRAAEAAAKAAEAKPGEVDMSGPDQPEPVPGPSTQIKSGYGRAASVRKRMVVTGISDLAALADYMKDHPEVKSLMKQIAQRLIDNGQEVPGVIVEEQAVVR